MKNGAIKAGVFFLLIVAVCLGPGRCLADQPKQGGVVSVGINTDITTLDPHASPALVNAIVWNHVVEPLVAYGQDLKVMPVLAESLEASPDYKTYTIKLVKGKLFHNGREMKADDVKWSLERIMDPATKCPRASLFKKVDKVEAVDDYTVKILLKESFAGFPHVLAYLSPIMAIMPKETVDPASGTITHPLGTGPFKFLEWKPDRHVILERFDDYKPGPGPRNGLAGDKTAYVDRVKFVPITEESVSLMALVNKEVDVLQFFPPKYVEKYNKQYKDQGLVLDEVTGLVWVEIFFGVTQPVTKNLKFRQACAYAIDREMVTQAGYLGHATVNPSVIPKQNQYWTPKHAAWYEKDAAKAKQLLKESGYNGEEVLIDTTKKYDYMYRVAVAVQAELQAIGVNAKLNILEWPVLLQKNLKGESQIQAFGAAPMPDPTLGYQYLTRNKFFETCPQARELFEKSSATDYFETRKLIFEQLHKLTMEQVPWIVFFNYNRINCYQDYVKGYEALGTGMPRLWGVWLEK